MHCQRLEAETEGRQSRWVYEYEDGNWLLSFNRIGEF